MFLGGVFLYLQIQVWFGLSGYFAQEAIKNELTQKRDKLMILKNKNQVIGNQIQELKRTPESIESYARSRLGMIRKGELFFLVPKKDA